MTLKCRLEKVNGARQLGRWREQGVVNPQVGGSNPPQHPKLKICRRGKFNNEVEKAKGSGRQMRRKRWRT